MEPPASAPPTSVPSLTPTAPLSGPPYPPDSVESSPRSRTTDTWENNGGDALPPVPGGAKLRLMCSYGGHIVPRPHDKSLCYVGGETRIVVVERNSSLPELLNRLSRVLLNGRPFTLKYQLPNEDLDSLITVSSDEDLENMIDEYDRLNTGPNPARNSRIRLFLFPTKLDVAASMGPILDGSNKSDDWFMSVLNTADLLERGYSDPSAVNTLLGLEENGRGGRNLDLNSHEGEAQAVVGGGMGGAKGKLGNQSNPDVHSVLDSSMAETNSSFGSASSSPAMLNLPRIRVHMEEGGVGGGGARVCDQRIGIEDQFAQMGVNAQKLEEGFIMMSSPPSNLPVTGAPVGVPGEYTNRIVSDDERSDHGAPVGYQTRQPPQMVMVPNSQPQTKQITEDLPSPAASVSSDCSNLSNTTSRQKPLYQDPSGNNRAPASFIDPRMAFADTSAQVQQAPDSGYVLPSQHYDQLQQQQAIRSQQAIQSQQQQQQQAQHAQHAQAQQQAQQAQHAQAQQQAQQFIHASNQYVHHHPAGGMPLSYYPVYPSQQPQSHQQQLDQRYPVYYVPAGQAHPYNLPVQQQQQQQQQPTYTEAASTTRMMAPHPQKPEIPQAGVYRAAVNAPNPQLVQMPQQQQPQQFMGYPQMHHHPSQSMAPASAAGQYAYELSDPAHAQVYFTQAPLAPQYQTMNSGPAMVIPDASAANPNDNAKQQIRTSQPL